MHPTGSVCRPRRSHRIARNALEPLDRTSEERDLPTFRSDPEANWAINDALPEVVVDAFRIATSLCDGATLVAASSRIARVHP